MVVSPSAAQDKFEQKQIKSAILSSRFFHSLHLFLKIKNIRKENKLKKPTLLDTQLSA